MLRLFFPGKECFRVIVSGSAVGVEVYLLPLRECTNTLMNRFSICFRGPLCGSVRHDSCFRVFSAVSRVSYSVSSHAEEHFEECADGGRCPGMAVLIWWSDLSAESP